MKKVLFISSRPIYPLLGGDRIRTAQQLEFLTHRYCVDVIYMTETPCEDMVDKYLPKVNSVKQFVVSRWLCYFQTLRAIFNSLPLQVNYYYNSSVKEYIYSNVGKYDVIFCNNIRTAEYARSIVGPARYIDFVDAVSMNYEKAIREAHGIKRLIYKYDSKRCRCYEQILLQSFDACAIISDVDKNYILECPSEFIP